MSKILQLLGDFRTQAPTGDMPPDLTGGLLSPSAPQIQYFWPPAKIYHTSTGAISIFPSLRLWSSWSVGVERRMLRSWI